MTCSRGRSGRRPSKRRGHERDALSAHALSLVYRRKHLLHGGDAHPGLAHLERAMSVHFSSRTDEWATPQILFDQLHAEFGFTLDPCATPENAKCPHFFTKAHDGLLQAWGGVVFMNPPYGRVIKAWMKKAFESAQAGATVVCLVPARTDTSWWHDFAMKGEIRFLRGRVKFGDGRNSAPFPSALVIFRPNTCGCGGCRGEYCWCPK